MNDVDPTTNEQSIDRDTLPFVAPCRQLRPFAALGWMRLGIRDLRKAPMQSLAYGFFMALVMAVVTWLAWNRGSHYLMLAMLGGFVFLAPLTCIGLYAISAQLERGQPVSMERSLRAAFKRHIGNELTFAIVLLVVFLVWSRAALMITVFFPVGADPDLSSMAPYLAIGTTVGAFFAIVTFFASAFSLPMIMHRDVDTITAVVTSINAALRNKFAALLWLTMIMAGLAIGFLTAFIGLVVILPIIGYGTWHGYLETIDAAEFPRHSVGITSIPRHS